MCKYVDMNLLHATWVMHVILDVMLTKCISGLSVEGLKMYQDQLPDRPGVIKVNAAISDPQPGETTADFFYIHPNDIKKYHLPPWLKGCNAVGKPQTEASRILTNRNLTRLLQRDIVPVLGIEQLLV